MDGYGTYFYKNGSIYDGEFIEDEAHGVGTFRSNISSSSSLLLSSLELSDTTVYGV